VCDRPEPETPSPRFLSLRTPSSRHLHTPCSIFRRVDAFDESQEGSVVSEGLTISEAATSTTRSTTATFGTDDDGYKTVNDYAYITQLGQGAYGKVKLVRHIPTDEYYAMKILNKRRLSRVRTGPGQTALDDVHREIAIMQTLDHPNVVRLHEVIDDPSCKKIYLIMDYVEDGPVWNVGEESVPVSKIRKYLVGMCEGLDYLHSNNIVHRDIKPGNILVDADDNVRLCDFGVSQVLNAADDLVRDSAGTPAFLSPEQCKSQPLRGDMVDLWALGVTLYCMTFGRIPFGEPASPRKGMTDAICAGASFEGCPDPELKDLLQLLLHVDPEERIGRKDGVREILRHPFICAEEQPQPYAGRTSYPCALREKISQARFISCSGGEPTACASV